MSSLEGDRFLDPAGVEEGDASREDLEAMRPLVYAIAEIPPQFPDATRLGLIKGLLDYYFRADSYGEQQKLSLAVADLDIAVFLSPRDAEVVHLRGFLHMAQRRTRPNRPRRLQRGPRHGFGARPRLHGQCRACVRSLARGRDGGGRHSPSRRRAATSAITADLEAAIGLDPEVADNARTDPDLAWARRRVQAVPGSSPETQGEGSPYHRAPATQQTRVAVNSAARIPRAVRAIWPALPDLVGSDWPLVEQKLVALLDQSDAPGADLDAIAEQILRQLAPYQAAQQYLLQVLADELPDEVLKGEPELGSGRSAPARQTTRGLPRRSREVNPSRPGHSRSRAGSTP